MFREIVYFGDVDDEGVLRIRNRKELDQDLLTGFTNTKVRLGIKRAYKSRTSKQNNVFHLYVDHIADETGHEFDEIRDILKKMFLTEFVADDYGNLQVDEDTGEVLQDVPSTASLSAPQFDLFNEKIRLWAMYFLKIYLPLPNDKSLIFNQ